ncbi:TPA: hypothetical protein ACN976_004992 [Vibrio campbellii]
MSHPIYFNKICNDAMFLEQVVSGSETYVVSLHKEYFVEKKYDYECTDLDLAYDEYFGWLYENVSSLLIQCATQTRIYQDTYVDNDDEDLHSSDKEAYEHITDIVELISGKFSPSLRECCNKIIHAETFELELISTNESPKYWNGKCSLKGRLGNNCWHIKMDILKFCFAIRYFYSLENH